MPLSAQSWDIQLARPAAYEKLSIFRGSLRDIQKQNKESGGKHQSEILSSLLTQLSILDFYLAKLESYMRRKHDQMDAESVMSETDS